MTSHEHAVTSCIKNDNQLVDYHLDTVGINHYGMTSFTIVQTCDFDAEIVN